MWYILCIQTCSGHLLNLDEDRRSLAARGRLSGGGDCVPLCRGQGSVRMPAIPGRSRISVKWQKWPKMSLGQQGHPMDYSNLTRFQEGSRSLKRGTWDFFSLSFYSVYLGERGEGEGERERETPWFFRAKSCHPGGIVRCLLSIPTEHTGTWGFFSFVWS